MNGFLKKIPIFANLSNDMLHNLHQVIEPIHLVAGEELFAEGSIGDRAYIIKEGEISIIKGAAKGETLLAIRKPGEVIGEMSLLDSGPRTATVRANVDSLLLAISQEQFENLLDNNPSVARIILRTIIQPRWRASESLLQQREQTLLQQSKKLKQTLLALQEAHDELEQRVAARTAELAQANQVLTEQIVEREQAEAALRESEERFRIIAKTIPVPIVIARIEDGLILYTNDLFEKMLNLDVGTLIGKDTPDFYRNPIDRKNLLTKLERDGYVRDFEFQAQKIDGTLFWVSISVQIITFEGSKVLFTAVRDVTERREAEEQLKTYRDHLEELVSARTVELQQANARLQQEITRHKETAKALRQAKEAAEIASRAKSEFLANMSHELRTPLNAILGFSQLMQRDEGVNENQQKNLHIINRSGEHLLSLINDILTMSKIEAGRITLNETDFDVYRMLTDLENMFRLRVSDKGLNLAFERAANVPNFVHCDPGKLRQVLINLLNNAIKFTEAGGIALRINFKPTNFQNEYDGHPFHVPFDVSENQVEPIDSLTNLNTSYYNPADTLKGIPLTGTLFFEVIDTGPGIAPEELANLFQAFMQTETGRRSQQGSGLGLSISQRFVQLMGGNIYAESEVGVGSTFRFDIQVDLAQASDLSKQHISRRVLGLADNQPVYRLLVVEDKEESRELLVILLQSVGFEVQAAENGLEATKIAEAWHPHLIWMDMRMPVMDGYEATKRIKAAPATQSSVIIALTASAFEEERAVALSVGCSDFTLKPFRESDIFEKIKEHLGVTYIYEAGEEDGEGGLDTLGDDSSEEVIMSASTLPGDLIANLQVATIQGRFNQMLGLIEEIRTHNPAFANKLANLVNNYAYDDVLLLLQTK